MGINPYHIYSKPITVEYAYCGFSTPIDTITTKPANYRDLRDVGIKEYHL